VKYDGGLEKGQGIKWWKAVRDVLLRVQNLSHCSGWQFLLGSGGPAGSLPKAGSVYWKTISYISLSQHGEGRLSDQISHAF